MRHDQPSSHGKTSRINEKSSDQMSVRAFVESLERFIEQHERCLKAQRTRKAGPSSFAAREPIGSAIQQVRIPTRLTASSMRARICC